MTTLSGGHVLETSCLTMGLSVSCYRRVGHTVVCFLCLIRYLLIKEKKVKCMVRYSLSEYDKTCITITRILKIYKLNVF